MIGGALPVAEPLDLAWAPIRPDISGDVRNRLEARARAGHFVTAQGGPDIGALMDAKLLDLGAGQITMAQVDAVMTDPADPDLAELLKAVVRSTLLAEGRPDLARTV